MSDNPYAAIQADYLESVDRWFGTLQALDSELGDRLISTFGSRHAAIHWLMSSQVDGNQPIVLLAIGRRSEVIEALFRFEHGVYT